MSRCTIGGGGFILGTYWQTYAVLAGIIALPVVAMLVAVCR